MVIGVIIAAATFLLRVWLNERSERRRKKELVNAVYHHVDEAIDRLVASYFYTQSSLHAVEESFNLEHVRSWSSSRKLQLWEIYAEYRERVLRDALGARKTLRRIMDKKY